MKVILIIMAIYPGGYTNSNHIEKYPMPTMEECLKAVSATKSPLADEKSKVVITCGYEK